MPAGAYRIMVVSAALILVAMTPASCASGRRQAEGNAPASNANYVQPIPGSDVQFEMVWIEEGSFWIGRHEVTWDEYLLFCDFRRTDRKLPGFDAVSRPSEPIVPYDRDWGFGRRPAVGMSWNAAKRYCEWLSLKTGHTYRLPTETEWALACGPAPDELDAYTWHYGNSDDMTHEVGAKPPNEHGLHDMLGNLWEYCQNPWSEDDPKRAVLRGGSWKEDAQDIAPENRLRFEKDWVLADPNVPAGVWWVPDGDHLGFRVLRAADE